MPATKKASVLTFYLTRKVGSFRASNRRIIGRIRTSTAPCLHKMADFEANFGSSQSPVIRSECSSRLDLVTLLLD